MSHARPKPPEQTLHLETLLFSFHSASQPPNPPLYSQRRAPWTSANSRADAGDMPETGEIASAVSETDVKYSPAEGGGERKIEQESEAQMAAAELEGQPETAKVTEEKDAECTPKYCIALGWMWMERQEGFHPDGEVRKAMHYARSAFIYADNLANCGGSQR